MGKWEGKGDKRIICSSRDIMICYICGITDTPPMCVYVSMGVLKTNFTCKLHEKKIFQIRNLLSYNDKWNTGKQ